MGFTRKHKVFFGLLGIIALVIIGTILLNWRNTATEPLNVLLITIDALRPDHLGCYGYKRNTTPNIDKLAQEGVKFSQAISQGPMTIPSIPSLMTGLYPYRKGMGPPWQKFSYSTLAQILKQHGYYTGLIVANEVLSLTGIKNGFDDADFIPDAKADIITREAGSWLSKNKERRFFLWLHYFDPHSPYTPPGAYRKKYLNDKFSQYKKDIPISNEKQDAYHAKDVIPLHVAESGITSVDYYIAQYDGEISFTDEQVGILLKKIDDLGLDKKTLIIITADHGEHLGEHGCYFFHNFLFDDTLRVPLILRCKGEFPGNRTVYSQVALVDIMPTLLELLKIRVNIPTAGINLTPVILRKKTIPDRVIFSAVFNLKPSKRFAASLRTETWKLIYSADSGEYRLYNLKNDPGELVDLAVKEKAQFQILRQRLDGYVAEALNGLPETPSVDGGLLDQNMKRRLRNLGYLQ